MKYELDTKVRGESRGTPMDWKGYADRMKSHRPEDVGLFSATVYDLCDRLHIRAEVIMGLYALASNHWHSYVWNTRCNPYGSWCTKDESGKNFGAGDRAARAIMVNMWLLLSGKELPAELSQYRHLDTMWDRILSSGSNGSVKTLGDLIEHFGVHWDAVENILNEDLPFIIKENDDA